MACLRPDWSEVGCEGGVIFQFLLVHWLFPNGLVYQEDVWVCHYWWWELALALLNWLSRGLFGLNSSSIWSCCRLYAAILLESSFALSWVVVRRQYRNTYLPVWLKIPLSMRQPHVIFVSIGVGRNYTLVVWHRGQLELHKVVVATFAASDGWLEGNWHRLHLMTLLSGKNEGGPMLRQVWDTMVLLCNECIFWQHARLHVESLCLKILPDHGLVLVNLPAPVIVQKTMFHHIFCLRIDVYFCFWWFCCIVTLSYWCHLRVVLLKKCFSREVNVHPSMVAR